MKEYSKNGMNIQNSWIGRFDSSNNTFGDFIAYVIDGQVCGVRKENRSLKSCLCLDIQAWRRHKFIFNFCQIETRNNKWKNIDKHKSYSLLAIGFLITNLITIFPNILVSNNIHLLSFVNWVNLKNFYQY